MKHLRDSGVKISGAAQKRRLKNIGYYHGYKGYRFARRASNKLSIDDFSQVADLYDFDMRLKALFYPRIMSIETALKNYTLEAVVKDANSSSFEDIWRKSLTDYRSYTGGVYRKAWETRQRLRSEVDSIIYDQRGRDVIGHFRDTDREVPIWAIFEVMTLGNFGAFCSCLDRRVKTRVVRDLGMPASLDSELRLKEIVFALKDFRNAIAHNGVVLDVRFQSGSVSSHVSQLLKQETGVGGIDFADATDYVVLLTYLLRCMRLTKTECRQLVEGYERTIEHCRSKLPFNVYSTVIKTSTRGKLAALKKFVG